MSHYEINTPSIVGKVIDGEAIIMNMITGSYYSSLGVGAAIWSYIEAGCTVSIIKKALIKRFPDSGGDIARDLVDFLAQLQGDNLIRVAAKGKPEQTPNARLLDMIKDYSRPEIQIYTDMQDLLLLDSVHEVDETGGPAGKK